MASSPAVPDLPSTPVAIWLAAIRPKTLTAAAAPVVLGTAFAYADHSFQLFPAIAALFGAFLIQIGTNLANDYFDFRKGADSTDRVGPIRVTAAGLVRPESMRNAMLAVFAAALVSGIYLVTVGGWPIVLIGLASIVSGILYTGGPYPLGYNGLGDLFVLIFFGLVATSGAYYVQANTITPEVLLAGISPGLLSVAILTINNLRDIESDRRAGKKTLVARFGRDFGKMHLLLVMLVAHQVPIVLTLLQPERRWTFLSLVTMPFALLIVANLFRSLDPRTCNRALAQTAMLLLIHSLLFALGWNL